MNRFFSPRPLITKALQGLLVSILLISCSQSYYLLNQAEITRAYRKSDAVFLPSLKKVVLKENRDLKAASLYYLGRYYEDYTTLENEYLLDTKEEPETDPEEIAEAQQISENKQYIESFLFEYYDDVKDFNLKNLAANALTLNNRISKYHNTKLNARNKTTYPLAEKNSLWLLDKTIEEKDLAVKINLINILKENLTTTPTKLLIYKLDPKNPKIKLKLTEVKNYLISILQKVNSSSEVLAPTFSFQTTLEVILLIGENTNQTNQKTISLLNNLLTQFKQHPYQRIVLKKHLAHYQALVNS